MDGHRDAESGRFLRRSLSILSLGIILALGEIASGQVPLTQLNAISIHKMTDAEYAKRISDNVATKYIVRFRLEASGDEGIYVLVSGPKGAPPLGYVLERSANGIVWVDVPDSQNQFKSPGVEKLAKQSGARWILLPASAAYEWEIEAEASKTDIDESRSVFVRRDMNSRPTELTSSWYTVGDKVAY